MKIITVDKRSTELISKLIIIWGNAVRATHSFLKESEIQYFKKTLPTVLLKIPILVIATDSNNLPVGFMGINGPEIDFLFIDSSTRGSGIGKELVNFGIKQFHASQITVNEQNPQAVGFYKHMRFVTYSRQATDDQGLPHPVLKMRLKKVNNL